MLKAKLLSGLAMAVFLFSLFGCSADADSGANTSNADSEGVHSIRDFSAFSAMTQDGTDKIEVTFDNYSGAPFYFTIENKEHIDEVMKIIFSSSFENCGQEMNDGSHTSIKIIQGEKEYVMRTSINKNGDYYYAFLTTELSDKIIELAREAGAYKSAE